MENNSVQNFSTFSFNNRRIANQTKPLNNSQILEKKGKTKLHNPHFICSGNHMCNIKTPTLNPWHFNFNSWSHNGALGVRIIKRVNLHPRRWLWKTQRLWRPLMVIRVVPLMMVGICCYMVGITCSIGIIISIIMIIIITLPITMSISVISNRLRRVELMLISWVNP